MTADESGREVAFTAKQKQVVARWLRHKLGQAKAASEHYSSMPRKMRTAGDDAAMLHWHRVIGIIHWLAPGGRGLYDQERQDGQQGADE